MSLTDDHLRRIARTANAPDLGFVDLVGLAELNPATAFHGAVLRGNLSNQNLAGFDFTGAQFLESCDLTGADLSQANGITHQSLSRATHDETTILPRALFWATGQPPSWAEDWGRDVHGPWVTFRLPNTSIIQRMRWCPQGGFTMGSPGDEPGRFDEEGPQLRVTIDQGFWMFETVCTEALWTEVMIDLPRSARGVAFPVTGVSWDDTQTFIQRLNTLLTGLAIDLPSEARWEYACRAGTQTPYSFGKRATKKQVCFNGKAPVDAGSLPANPWGLHEMHGNVWEWCSDNWHATYTDAPTDGSAWLDADNAASRVLRGGSWDDDARGVRSACRGRLGPAVRLDSLSFRCARVQAPGEAARAAAPANPARRASAERAR